jgi:hypothetical protein
MNNREKIFFTIDEIDGMTSIGSPHKKELFEIGAKISPILRKLDNPTIEEFAESVIGGKIENIGVGEDWTMTKELYPEVKIHMAYTYYGDEFGDSEIDGVKFLFSGERIKWITGEDLASFVDLTVNYQKRALQNRKVSEKDTSEQSDMLKTAIIERYDPFYFLEDEDIPIIVDFIGGTFVKEKEWMNMYKQIYPGVTLLIKFTEDHSIEPRIIGGNSYFLENYEKDIIKILVINHILRYITIRFDERDLPEICVKMFPKGYFKK